MDTNASLVENRRTGAALTAIPGQRREALSMRRPLDRSTWIGIAVAVAGIAAGLMLDGGRMLQILQPTAALVVFGGTLGAVMVQFPMSTLREALGKLKQVFVEPQGPSPVFVEQLLGYALKARRRGLVALDADLPGIEDPFLRRCLTCAVDGMRRPELIELMDIELDLLAEKDETLARVFEAAGGFAPTIGIIGAVLGLIQVMQRLDNISEVGRGIAVAFVATLYGVGSANLLFLPLAGKVRVRAREAQHLRELMLESALAIADGISPRALRQRYDSYLQTPPEPRKPRLREAEPKLEAVGR